MHFIGMGRSARVVMGRVCTIALALALVACGGGGGGTAAPPPPAPVTTNFSVGGTVSGLPNGASVVLRINGGNDLTVSANGAFTFTANLATGAAYAVTVQVPPTGETCTIANGGGTVSGNVVNVQVTCSSTPHFLYVAGAGNSTISAFVLDPASGALSAVAGSPFVNPGSPVSIAVTPNSNYAYVANSAANNVSAYSIAASGALTPVPGSPFAAGTYPSAVTVDPPGRFAFVANYMSHDVYAYKIDAATGALTPVVGSPYVLGTQATALTVNASGTLLYAVTVNSGIAVFSINPASGALAAIPGSPFLTGALDAGGITLAASGKIAYVAQGSHGVNDVVSAFAVDPTTGALLANGPGQYAAGSYPYMVALDPGGRFAFVPNGVSSNVSGYTINATTGALTPIVGSPFPAGPYPTFAVVDPTGAYLYVCNTYPASVTANVSAYAIDPASGALTALPGSPYAVGGSPFGMAIK